MGKAPSSNRWPFQSAEAADICAHLSSEESIQVQEIRGKAAAIAAALLIPALVMLRLATESKFRPIEGVLGMVGVVGIALLVVGGIRGHCQVLRSVLAATAYSRNRSLASAEIRLFARRRS